MSKTKIEWVSQFDENGNIISQGYTFNPWWGCVKISPGCKNCYAEARQYGGDWWGIDKPRRFFGEKHWKQPLKWNADAEKKGIRYRVFCGSYCDVFEEQIEIQLVRPKLGRLIRETPNLDWLILTKRPENITAQANNFGWVEPYSMLMGNWNIPDNVWLGVSVENQEMADERIPELLKIPAKVRFVSCEPLLERITLVGLAFREWETVDNNGNPVHGLAEHDIGWIIVGGESGPNKRDLNPDWARTIREQCKSAGIPFFMKQIDKVQPIPEDLMIREYPHV